MNGWIHTSPLPTNFGFVKSTYKNTWTVTLIVQPKYGLNIDPKHNLMV